MALDPREFLRRGVAQTDAPVLTAQPVGGPLGGTRAERLQRLQIGGFGILAMVLLIALADIVISRAQVTQANAVPEAAPTVVATATSTPRDPLADAGVVPELPTEPTATPAGQTAADQGDLPPPSTKQNAPLQ